MNEDCRIRELERDNRLLLEHISCARADNAAKDEKIKMLQLVIFDYELGKDMMEKHIANLQSQLNMLR